MKNKLHLITYIAVFIGIVLIAVVMVTSLDGANTASDGYYAFAQTKWPENDLTDGFPKFDGDIYSVTVNGTSTAVYFQDVEKTAADKYVSQLASSGLNFKSGDYPKTAQKGDTFVTLAYNEETKKLSVTFAQKSESDISS